MQNVKIASLSSWDVVYAVNMAIACLISYWVVTYVLSRIVGMSSDLLAGMWTVVATIFVFRETRLDSLSAGTALLIATCVSFALCMPYLWIFPSTPVGMAVVLAVGTVVMTLLGRRDDIVFAGLATAIVLVVAEMRPLNAWQLPLLRLADTVVGIAIGVSCKWIASSLFYRLKGSRLDEF